MRLKSLELHGFKSFPDKTTIKFDNGMTVIVGPNGSGKSNISDAMRWVLGELSTKNIRGTKMEDVIFGGSSSRSPMGYAEVSLVIDNTGDGNKIAVDYDEVEVTRRYYRSGESEYMINRRPARLKDIHEMFMNTGVGKTGYSIVSQGKAAEIISQKSDERRNIFEEAAGISKYRYKKNETERKLAATNDNLLRLNDIKNELEGRVGPLEKDAEKAKKYLEFYEKKKNADISLWLYDTKDIREKLEDTERSYILASKELEIADEVLESLEKQNDRLFTASQENKLQAEKNSSDLKEANEKMFGFETSVKILEKELDHLSQLYIQKNSEYELRNAEMAALQKEHQEVSLQLEKLIETVASSEKEKENSYTALESAQLELADIEKTLEQYENIIKEKENETLKLKLDLSSLSGSCSSRNERKNALNSKKTEIENSISLLNDRAKKAESVLKAYKDKSEESKKEFEAIEQEISTLDEKIKHANNALGMMYVEIASKKQRADALSRMEELFEGYANSVRFVMNEASKQTLEGVYGPVSKLITVIPKYTLAIETALGGNLQNIVVRDEECAKSAIALLKAKNAGRATFYPLTSIKPQELTADKNTIAALKGFIGIASELIDCDSLYIPVNKYLLGRTLVFDNIDNAGLAAKKTGYKYKTVTLDGQVINAGGSYTGGSAKKESGMLTRTAEIDRLKNEYVTLRKKADESQKEIDTLTQQRDKLVSDKESRSGNSSLLISLYNAENTQYEILKTQIDADVSALKSVSDELYALEKAEDLYKINKEKIEASINEIAEFINAGNGSLQEKKEEAVSKNKQIELLRQSYSNAAVKLAENKKDLDSAQKSSDNTKNSFDSLTVLTREISQEIEKLKAKEKITSDKLASDKHSYELAVAEIKDLERSKGIYSDKSDEIEKKLNDIRNTIKEKTNTRELCFRSYTQLESQKERLKIDLDKSSERIWDEYELTFNAALELEIEPVTSETRSETQKILSEYKTKLRNLGNVNVNAIEEYKEVKERYDFMSGQISDLENAEKQLKGIIDKLEVEMRDRFSQAMKDINMHFKTVFRELFGGGSAELILTDPSDVLTSGIDINVAPPGKIIKNLVSLSGGEQAFVAIALFFAILKVNPTPFCILDEIESALDEVNVVRFAEYARKYSDSTQFIMITHRRGTMESADTLYGVTMYEKGISKVLTVNVRDIEEKLGVKFE